MRFHLDFKLNVSQLRGLFLGLSFLLAAGLLAAGTYSMTAAGGEGSDVAVVDRSRFVYEPIAINVRSGAERLQLAADWLQPRAPEPPAIEEEDDGGEPEAAPEEEIAEGGPLAEKWEYSFYFISNADPRRTLVQLRKKKDLRVGTTRARSSRATRSTAFRRRSRLSRRGRRRAAPTQDTVTFVVGDRFFRDEERELEFYIESADEKRFVYWTEEHGPRRMFSLPYTEPITYGRAPDDASILQPEEGEQKDSVEEEEKRMIRVPENYESNREEEYERLKDGEITPPEA